MSNLPTESRGNGLSIEAIKPENGSKFSPNLYRWLTAKGKEHRQHTSKVYAETNGTLWIGHPADFDEFIGQKLISVLCSGVKAGSGAWGQGLLGRLTEVPDFWARYQRDGRCAIDTGHQMFFIGDESRLSNGGYQCNWCGHKRIRLGLAPSRGLEESRQ